MANKPELLEPKDLTEDELRELVTQLRDAVYAPGREEGAEMMEAVYAAFKQYRLAHYGD